MQCVHANLSKVVGFDRYGGNGVWSGERVLEGFDVEENARQDGCCWTFWKNELKNDMSEWQSTLDAHEEKNFQRFSIVGFSFIGLL